MADVEAPSLSKWLSGFLRPTTWAKSLVFIIMAAIIVGLPFYAVWRIDRSGFLRGKAAGVQQEQEIFRQYLKENPPIRAGNGTTINNNVCKKVDTFGLQFKGFTVGMVCQK